MIAARILESFGEINVRALLPRVQVPTMVVHARGDARIPFEQGRLLDRRELKRLAQRRGATPSQIALRWILRQDGIIAVPKAGTPEHVRENRAALDLALSPEDLSVLDQAFPPPGGPIGERRRRK